MARGGRRFSRRDDFLKFGKHKKLKQRFTVSMVERSVTNKYGEYELTEEYVPSRKSTIFKSRKILEHQGTVYKSPQKRGRKYTEQTVKSDMKDSWITSATPGDKSTAVPRTMHSNDRSIRTHYKNTLTSYKD